MEYKKNLISIDHTKREAAFQKLDSEDLETETLQVCIEGDGCSLQPCNYQLSKSTVHKIKFGDYSCHVNV